MCRVWGPQLRIRSLHCSLAAVKSQTVSKGKIENKLSVFTWHVTQAGVAECSWTGCGTAASLHYEDVQRKCTEMEAEKRERGFGWEGKGIVEAKFCLLWQDYLFRAFWVSLLSQMSLRPYSKLVNWLASDYYRLIRDWMDILLRLNR